MERNERILRALANPQLSCHRISPRQELLTRGHGVASDLMPVLKQFFEFPTNEPPAKEFTDYAERQFVFDAVFEGADARALGSDDMGMIPATKWAGDLHVAELAAFDVIAVLENPAHMKRPDAHAHGAAVSIPDSGSTLFDCKRLPGRREPLECAWLGVPAKNFFGWRFDPALGDKFSLMCHSFREGFPPQGFTRAGTPSCDDFACPTSL
jgi:hypothetical protein